jgi:hypothetical protein
MPDPNAILSSPSRFGQYTLHALVDDAAAKVMTHAPKVFTKRRADNRSGSQWSG